MCFVLFGSIIKNDHCPLMVLVSFYASMFHSSLGNVVFTTVECLSSTRVSCIRIKKSYIICIKNKRREIIKRSEKKYEIIICIIQMVQLYVVEMVKVIVITPTIEMFVVLFGSVIKNDHCPLIVIVSFYAFVFHFGLVNVVFTTIECFSSTRVSCVRIKKFLLFS